MAGFNLALIAVLAFIIFLFLFLIGHTIYGLYSSRKSEETGQVDDDFVLRGGSDTKRISSMNPRVGSETTDKDNGVPLKSYDDDDLDNLDDVELPK